MKSFTNIVSFVLLATAGNVMSNVIRRAPLPETETVLFKSNTTLNLDGLKARQLSIPSLTLCQNSNCEGPCYTYYLGKFVLFTPSLDDILFVASCLHSFVADRVF